MIPYHNNYGECSSCTVCAAIHTGSFLLEEFKKNNKGPWTDGEMREEIYRLRDINGHLLRLIGEAHGEFLNIAARFGAEDTRWMLEAEILLCGGTIPKKGLSRGALKQVLTQLSASEHMKERNAKGWEP